MTQIITNKQGLHHYEILEKYEAGIVLTGPEVKSLKSSRVNFRGSYITIDENNEAWLMNCHIAPYPPASGSQKNYDPLRRRKLLLSKKEIITLKTKVRQPGLTIIPISVYTKGSLVKIEIGLGRGKKQWDKREKIRRREQDREIRRRMKQG